MSEPWPAPKTPQETIDLLMKQNESLADQYCLVTKRLIRLARKVAETDRTIFDGLEDIEEWWDRLASKPPKPPTESSSPGPTAGTNPTPT